MTVPSGPVLTSTTTASGSSTRLRATYSTRSLAAIGLLYHYSRCDCATIAGYLAAGAALRATLGVMPAFWRSRETVSDGDAPWASHFLTFSASTTNSTGSVRGL